MFQIIDMRMSNDLFCEPRVSASHATLQAAVKKAQYLFAAGHLSPDHVCVPIKTSIGVAALVFSGEAERKVRFAAQERGFLFLDTYAFFGDELDVLAVRAFEFSSQTGEYAEIGEPLLWEGDDEIGDCLRSLAAPKRVSSAWR